MVFNATFNNISVISWWLVLLVEESGVPGEDKEEPGTYIFSTLKKIGISILFIIRIKNNPSKKFSFRTRQTQFLCQCLHSTLCDFIYLI
jgi:hypothetical protein